MFDSRLLLCSWNFVVLLSFSCLLSAHWGYQVLSGSVLNCPATGDFQHKQILRIQFLSRFFLLIEWYLQEEYWTSIMLNESCFLVNIFHISDFFLELGEYFKSEGLIGILLSLKSFLKYKMNVTKGKEVVIHETSIIIWLMPLFEMDGYFKSPNLLHTAG